MSDLEKVSKMQPRVPERVFRKSLVFFDWRILQEYFEGDPKTQAPNIQRHKEERRRKKKN